MKVEVYKENAYPVYCLGSDNENIEISEELWEKYHDIEKLYNDMQIKLKELYNKTLEEKEWRDKVKSILVSKYKCTLIIAYEMSLSFDWDECKEYTPEEILEEELT